MLKKWFPQMENFSGQLKKYKVTINDLLAENEKLEVRAKASEKGKMNDTMEVILSQPFHQERIFVLCGRFACEMFKFLLCINFFEKITDRETVFMVILFPAPSGYIQRVLKRKKRLYFRRSKYMLDLQIIVEFRKSL